MDTQGQLKTVRANGTDLAYLEHGTGDGVVFVHGGLGDYRSWAFQLEPFARRYRVVSYSRRYHFPNDVSNGSSGYAAVDHRDDLAELIRTLRLAPAHLVASSYGAYISLLVAATYPKLVRTLVLGEPPLPTLLGADAVQAAAQQVEPSRQAFDRGDPEEAVRVFIDYVAGAGAFARFPAQVRQAMLDNAPEFRIEVSTDPNRYFAPFDCNNAGRIKAPTLLVTGEVSPPFLHQMTDALERCLPNPERAVIPRASHGMQNMNPEGYNDAVLEFLSRH